MTNRISQAFRALFGTPFITSPTEGTTRFGSFTAQAPMKVCGRDRFRVSMFPAPDGETCDICGRPTHLLVLEFFDDDEWQPLLGMHESKLPVMLSVLEDVSRALDSSETGIPPRFYPDGE